MSTTGSDISRIFSAKIDKTYSAFLSNTKTNDLLKEALFASVQDVYRQLSDQVDYDDLITVLRTEQVYRLNNNKIFTAPIPVISIALTVPLKYEVTCALPHNLANGDKVEFSEVAGLTTTPNINSAEFDIIIVSDTVFSIIVTSGTGTHTANTGQVDIITDGTEDKLIPDYGSLLSLKAKYLQPLGLTITNAKNISPIRVKVNKRNNIKTGELLNISGVASNTNANGDYYVKVINSYEFDLYKDKDLQVPISGNGAYAGTGTVKRILYKVATPYLSSRKISAYEDPTTSNPQFERADTMLKVYPANYTCEEITIDYLRYDITEIDVADTDVDLELYYSYDFLMYITDKAARMFFARTKDFESMQASILTEQSVSKPS